MKTNQREKGQAIVLIVLSIVGLIAMAALIVDGGNSYLNRRKAQTAADAAVLAAAHAVCVDKTPLDPDSLQEIVDKYAIEQNGVDSAAVVDTVKNSEFPFGKITVETTINGQTFFAKVFNKPIVTVKAKAAASCFLPAEANHLIPVAWTCNVHKGSVETCVLEKVPVKILDEIIAETPEYFKTYLLDEGDGETKASYMDDYLGNTQGKLIYIVMDDTDFNELEDCKELNLPDDQDGGDPPGAGLITCDFDGDGIMNIHGSERGWLELTGGGAVDIWTLMLDGYDGILNLPQWFVGSDGVKTSVFLNADAIKFRKSLVPVFNAICPIPGSALNSTTYETLASDCPTEYKSGDLIALSTGGQDYYRVPGVAVFVVTCVSQGNAAAQYCPGKDASGVKDNMKTIEGYFVDGYVAGGKISNSGFDLGVYVLSLTE